MHDWMQGPEHDLNPGLVVLIGIWVVVLIFALDL